MESFEKLFSDDEGPVKSLYKGSIAKSNQLQIRNKSKIRDLENEN